MTQRQEAKSTERESDTERQIHPYRQRERHLDRQTERQAAGKSNPSCRLQIDASYLAKTRSFSIQSIDECSTASLLFEFFSLNISAGYTCRIACIREYCPEPHSGHATVWLTPSREEVVNLSSKLVHPTRVGLHDLSPF